MSLSNTQIKKGKLKQIIYEQLQHYSRTGERIYSSINDVAPEAGWLSGTTTRRYSKIILQEIFKDPNTAKLVYDMIFGLITTSYQNIKKKCIDSGYKLLTTSTQWFKAVRDRYKAPSRLYVDVECIKEGHETSVRVGVIQGCHDCMIYGLRYISVLDYQDVLELANNRGLQAISFEANSKPLTETEFNSLIEIYKANNQDPDNYKSKTNVHINVKWKHLDCGYVFENSYSNIRSTEVAQYCPKCFSSIDQRQTFEAFEEAFQGYFSLSQPLEYNIPLSRILSNPAILLDNKYESIKDPRVHVDMFGVIIINGLEIKIAIEHQGPQHYSFARYLEMARSQDEKRSIYKSNVDYKEAWDHLVLRDKAKIKLFNELNKEGYYLIVVDYSIPVSKRAEYILQEFIRRTGLNPGQGSILDWI